jgi:hypothetical protein
MTRKDTHVNKSNWPSFLFILTSYLLNLMDSLRFRESGQRGEVVSIEHSPAVGWEIGNRKESAIICG